MQTMTSPIFNDRTIIYVTLVLLKQSVEPYSPNAEPIEAELMNQVEYDADEQGHFTMSGNSVEADCTVQTKNGWMP